MATALHPRTLLFGAFAAAVCVTALVLGSVLPTLPHPATLAAGVTLDLTVLVPGAYYALVVRPRRWSPLAVAPVAAAGLLVAAGVLPAGYRATLGVVEAAVVPAEAALLGWLAWRAVRAGRGTGAPGAPDPVSLVYASARAIAPARVAAVLATELAVLYYALLAWRARPHVPAGARAFSAHRRSGHGALVFTLLLITGVEGLVVHLLLAGASATAAWIATAVSVYGALWLLADYRAAVLAPPVLLAGGELWLRAGLRWRVRVARGQIVRVSRTAPDAPAGGHARSLAFLTEPNVWIECAAPVVLEGPYGVRRRATHLGLFADEPDRLTAALTGGDVA